MTTVGEIKRTIAESLGVELKSVPNAKSQGDVLTEAYVAQPKKFDLPTQGLSQKAKEMHLKLYEGYVEKLNRVSAELDTVNRAVSDSKGSAYRALKSTEVFCRNAVHLHELYFANISDVKSEVNYDDIAYMRLARDFGTFDDWQWDFMACAMAARNGWVVTGFDTFLQRYTNFIIDGDDVGIPLGCYPVIVLDVWEHAFVRDFEADRQKYVESMMTELDWDIIGKRVERAEMIAEALKR